MVKSTSLREDMSLIKELEELRLKQRLLIESLKRKENSKEDDLLDDISTKLDFLVSLFKDVSEDNSHDEIIEKKFEDLEERFNRLETLIKATSISRLETLKGHEEEIHQKMSPMINPHLVEESDVQEDKINTIKVKEIDGKESEHTTNLSNLPSNPQSLENMPPPEPESPEINIEKPKPEPVVQEHKIEESKEQINEVKETIPPKPIIEENSENVPRPSIYSQIPPSEKKTNVSKEQIPPSPDFDGNEEKIPPKPDFTGDVAKAKKKKWF